MNGTPMIEAVVSDAEAAEIRAGHTIAAARMRLVPETPESAELKEIVGIIADHLSSRSPERRSRMRREALVSVQEMEGMVRLLEFHMQALSSELNKVTKYTGAAAAYTRSARR